MKAIMHNCELWFDAHEGELTAAGLYMYACIFGLLAVIVGSSATGVGILFALVLMALALVCIHLARTRTEEEKPS